MYQITVGNIIVRVESDEEFTAALKILRRHVPDAFQEDGTVPAHLGWGRSRAPVGSFSAELVWSEMLEYRRANGRWPHDATKGVNDTLVMSWHGVNARLRRGVIEGVPQRSLSAFRKAKMAEVAHREEER